MKVLIFAGAGTSVELGIPSMAGLAKKFRNHCHQWSVHPDFVDPRLDEEMDIEHLIEQIDNMCGARKFLESSEELREQLGQAQKVRAEVEWFVQHSAERAEAYDAELMWGSLLRAIDLHDVTLATTNYDRAIEIAANAVGVPVDDGFEELADKDVVPWIGFSTETKRKTVIKLHGSTDWYAKDAGNEPVKLRHPTALHGQSELRLPTGEQLRSALILPSREKMLANQPYPRLLQQLLNNTDECELAVYIGSSLRDPHILEAVNSTIKRVPTFIVNPDPSVQVEGSTYINQCASTFLLSTLPDALASNPEERLFRAAREQSNGDHGVLGAARDLLDSDKETRVRCDAIELLDEMGATLNPTQLAILLRDDDLEVARYALSLVCGSSQSTDLLAKAQESQHAIAPASAFREDLELLRSMVST